jgi:hypothetical protein
MVEGMTSSIGACPDRACFAITVASARPFAADTKAQPRVEPGATKKGEVACDNFSVVCSSTLGPSAGHDINTAPLQRGGNVWVENSLFHGERGSGFSRRRDFQALTVATATLIILSKSGIDPVQLWTSFSSVPSFVSMALA